MWARIFSVTMRNKRCALHLLFYTFCSTASRLPKDSPPVHNLPQSRGFGTRYAPWDPRNSSGTIPFPAKSENRFSARE